MCKKEVELLAPVGDVKDFYSAIKNGANAVFFGLPKFNARMKAENISLENLQELVVYAHLKNVKCYVTLNTLLKDNEFAEIDSMIKSCMECKIDAFIVQDFGLIYYLKSKFKDIVLHGSTQLGVHNVRGARVAKSMGLSRIVLSRETTLKDIEDIKKNVDIELEVFIQGAMCVAFSGNCYLSSLKCNASGNRGECKQLCRLPYSLFDNTKKSSGYMISPRDNCMIPYLKNLIDLNVESFKIEGRLRSNNYISKATSIYRDAIDEIYKNNAVLNPDLKIKKLANLFSRGEFISGYFDTKNIINTETNNHLGQYIGTVLNTVKFKDIYKITIKSNKSLKMGDGLKFVSDGSIVSLGVGNVETIGNNLVLYGKNYIKPNSQVYLSLDSEVSDIDKSYKRKISFEFVAKLDKDISLTLIDDSGLSLTVYGVKPEPAIKNPITKDILFEQLSKIDNDIFQLCDIKFDIDNVFLKKSSINQIRRDIIEKYKCNFLQKPEIIDFKFPDFKYDLSYKNLAIVDENFDFKNAYDNLILSPNYFNKNTISKFLVKYKKNYTGKKLLINLPMISMLLDMPIIDDVVYSYKNDCIFIANNIYALDYIRDGVSIWAGIGLNLSNNFTMKFLKSKGVLEFVSSIEKWCPTIFNTYKVCKGFLPMMTFCHCPFQTLYNCNCDNCKYSQSLKLCGSNNFFIRRTKIYNCYFELVDLKPINLSYSNCIEDTRSFN